MKCVVCRFGETAPGTTTLTIERDAMTLVIKGVPGEVCDSCGEAYLDEDTMRNVDSIVEDAAASGTGLTMSEYSVRC